MVARLKQTGLRNTRGGSLMSMGGKIMLNILEGVLNKTQLDKARMFIRQGNFKDGSSYVGPYVKTIKKNQELALDKVQASNLNNIVMVSLYRHPTFVKIAFPQKISEPIYAHYTEGMKYGYHVDDAIMGHPTNYFRSDISCTIFLSDPEEYDGGELEILTSAGQQNMKLPAGDAVIYPTTSLHQVTEVTRGERLVAVSWIQSMVPHEEQREILYQFGQSVDLLAKERPGAQITLDLTNIYTNLKRRWCIG